MLYSMTGFGRGRALSADGAEIAVELSSVNRKQLEIRFNLPREFSSLENELRKVISSRISRGSLNCRIGCAWQQSTVGRAVVDRDYLRYLADECRAAAPESPVNAAALLALAGVLNSAEPAEDEAIRTALFQALETALDNFNSMRQAEGENLRRDLEKRLAWLEKLHARLTELASGVNAILKEKLLTRLAESGLAVDLNDERMLKELLFYADKADVTEELTRLSSHFDQFKSFLTPGAGDAGRSLDFLMQEMFREITTLGNKAGSGTMSPIVVEFKTELEKLREQIQNVE